MGSYPDQALARQAKYMGCLRKAGMPDRYYQRVIDDIQFRAAHVMEVRKSMGLPFDPEINQQIAREVMGEHRFFGIPELEKTYGPLSDDVKAALAKASLPQNELRALPEEWGLVADPGFSVCQALDVKHKRRGSTGWYRDFDFATCQQDPGWYLVGRKIPLRTGEDKEIQECLKSEGDFVPSVRQLLNFFYCHERIVRRVCIEYDWAITSMRVRARYGENWVSLNHEDYISISPDWDRPFKDYYLIPFRKIG